jgi:hypothetical protein
MLFPDFKRSRFAPKEFELVWILDWCKKNKFERVLEFGCGITTLVIYEGLSVSNNFNLKRYVTAENYEPSILEVKKFLHVPLDIEIVKTWKEIPKDNFDFVFIDSSSGCGKAGIHREKAVILLESWLSNPFIMIHDYINGAGKKIRRYLESKNYTLIDSLNQGYGVAVFRRNK